VIAWYLCPYKRDTETQSVRRYCAMNDFTAQIKADGGNWSETEVLGDQAIVKVSASAATLTTIGNTAGFMRFPLVNMNDRLSTINQAQRNSIQTRILAAGYTQAEMDAAFPVFANATFNEVLNFLATRRLKPRYDSGTDTIVLDGAIQACKPVDRVDREVT